MRERPIEDKPSLLEVVLVLLFILLVMAFAGKVDYQDALERDNRALAAENTRLRQALGMAAESPSPASGRGAGEGEGEKP